MKTPLGLLNLWHQQAKTIVSIGGVAFALLLVFMQLGFMGAVSNTATNVLENLQFDVLVRARDYVHLYEPSQFDRKWLQVAASTRGVSAAKPFWITIHNWLKLPTQIESRSSEFESQYLPIAIMASASEDNVFKLESVISQQSELHSGHKVLLDQSTQRDYGPLNGRKFDVADIDRETEIGGQTFSIGGLFSLGTGLAANGAVIASQQGFARIVPWDSGHYTSLGLIDVQSGTNVDEVVVELKKRFLVGGQGSQSTVVDVMSREQAMQQEQSRWLNQTPIGMIFKLGVAISLLVGAAIVYMVLSSDVASRLSEYATLLAMGYSRKYLASIVMTQAVTLCLCGFLVAWVGAELLYRTTSYFSGITISMNAMRAVYVLAMGLVMSSCSGLLALRKLWKAEPASLF